MQGHVPQRLPKGGTGRPETSLSMNKFSGKIVIFSVSCFGAFIALPWVAEKISSLFSFPEGIGVQNQRMVLVCLFSIRDVFPGQAPKTLL